MDVKNGTAQTAPRAKSSRARYLPWTSRQQLVFAADLAAGANDAAGKRQDDAGQLANRRGRRLRRCQASRLARGQDQEVTAADALDGAEDVLAGELAVHHRQAPVASPLEL